MPVGMIPRNCGIHSVLDFTGARWLGADNIQGIKIYSVSCEEVCHHLADTLELFAYCHATGSSCLRNMTRTVRAVVRIERFCQSIYNFCRTLAKPLMAKKVDEQQVGYAERNLMLPAAPEEPEAGAFFARRAAVCVSVIMNQDKSGTLSPV